MITRNIDVAGGVVNGTTGTIENIQPNLDILDTMNLHALPVLNTMLSHSTDVAIREQFPLILDWAITVHRVQGVTISSNIFVVMDFTFFGSGQVYVALSRVKKIYPVTC